MNFAEFLVGIRAVVAHHQIGDDCGVPRLNAEDIVALDPDAVSDLHHEERDRVSFLERAQIGNRDGRRCD